MKDTKQEAQNAVKKNDHEHSVEGKATQINELVMAQVKQTCEVCESQCFQKYLEGADYPLGVS